MSGSEKSHVLIVLSNAVEGQDDAFNDWYTNTHLGDVTALTGFVAAQRYRLSDGQVGDADMERPYRYLAIYEVKEDMLDAAVAALGAAAAERGEAMVISDALDMERTVAWMYSPTTGRVSAKR